jgi:hypothetical protein
MKAQARRQGKLLDGNREIGGNSKEELNMKTISALAT